jgi:hypothetical protein
VEVSIRILVAFRLQESCNFKGVDMMEGAVLGSELCKLDEMGFSFVGFVQVKFAY